MRSIVVKAPAFRDAGGALASLMLLGLLGGIALLGSTAAKAVSITGSMELGGGYTLVGGTDFVSATALDLNNVAATTPATGSLGNTIPGGVVMGSVNSTPLSYDPFVAIPNLLDIGDWQVDIDTLSVDSRSPTALFLTGTGTLSGINGNSGFDPTPATWSLSAGDIGGVYSMTVTAVPVPAALWLFGSGLVGLLAASRGKRN